MKHDHVRWLTLSAISAALGVVIMYIGSLIEVLDLSTVFLASILVVWLQIEAGKGWPWLVWLVTSALALLLLPSKFCALEYAFFGGLYPILKYYLQKLPPLIAKISKWLAFNLLFGLVIAFSFYVFSVPLELNLPFVGEVKPVVFLAVLFALANIVFFIYDILLDRLIWMYSVRWRQKIKRILK